MFYKTVSALWPFKALTSKGNVEYLVIKSKLLNVTHSLRPNDAQETCQQLDSNSTDFQIKQKWHYIFILD